MMGAARSAATVEGILVAVVEFVRFAASRGWCEPAVADAAELPGGVALSSRAAGIAGKRTGRPVVQPAGGPTPTGGATAGDPEP